MPAHISFVSVKDKIPAKWTSLNIRNPTSDNSEKYAFLKIKHRYKHYVCRVNRLKMLLEDGNENVIDFFALGQVADDLKTCEKGVNRVLSFVHLILLTILSAFIVASVMLIGCFIDEDFLLCLEFEVEECPGHCSRPFQIIADDTGEQKSLIWVSKPSTASVSPSTEQDEENTDIVVQPQTPNSDGKKTRQSYSYLKLSEIKINSVIDVYGVVKFVKQAVKGKGSDYYCVVGLTDPSILGTEEEKLVCVFFHRDLYNLPKVQEGDVLRLHRLKIQTYQGGKQGYNGPGFQWLAFHGSLDARTFSSLGYTFEEQDKELAGHLLEWWSKLPDNNLLSPQTDNIVKSTTQLASVNPKDYFDLVCQVVQVCVLEPDVCRLIRVWDGTKFEGQLKEVAEGELNQSLEEDNELVKTSEGFVVDIFLFDNHAKESMHIKPGDFLLLTNVHASVVSGLVELTVHGGGKKFNRGVQVLPSDSPEAQNLKTKLEGFLAQTLRDSNNCFTSDQSNQNSSTTRSDQIQKTVDSKGHGPSQEFIPRENGAEEDEAYSGLAIGKDSTGLPSIDQSLKISPRKVRSLHGRKDVPSKNKSLRRRMLYNEENINGNSTQIFYQNDGASTTSSEPEKGNHVLTPEAVVRVEDKTLEDKQTDSSGDSNQSIWLSIYNDLDSEGIHLKPVSSSDLHQEHVTEGKRPVPVNSKSSLRSPKSSSTSINKITSKGESLNNDESAVQGVQHKILGEEDELSSQDSFATAPSPNLRGAVDFQLTAIENQAVKRSAQQLNNGSYKRIKLSPGNKQDGNRRSEERAKETIIEQTWDIDMEDTTNNDVVKKNQEREESHNSFEYEKMLPHTFSQEHLEILDSQMLYSDSNDFSQTAKTDNSNDTEETQPSHNGEVIDMNEKSHSIQESQDFLQILTGESQVSSSTDSLKSSSEPRCMQKTASVVLHHPNIHLSTIQEVLDHLPPHKFRIQARVERLEPRLSSPHDLVHFLCSQCKFFTRMASGANDSDMYGSESMMCPKCVQPTSFLRAVSVLVLQLSDKHHTISTSVWDKNADQFFGGISAQQLLNDPNSFQQVQQLLNDLCPLGSSVESRPVLECCICSYYVDGDVKIQIFDTSLV